jgi:hypothetical protein
MRRTGLLLVLLGLPVVRGIPAQDPPASSEPLNGTLVVTQSLDRSGAMYIEGSLSYICVTDGDETVFEGQLEHDRLQHDLPSGTYTLASYQRPCDGNCGFLDPPRIAALSQ